MLPVAQAASQVGRAFDRVEVLPGSTYRDNSMVVVIPTRGSIHYRVVNAWNGLLWPMNQRRANIFAAGDEVGKAYDNMIATVLQNPELAAWPYLLTLEDDNLPPPDAVIRLLESIEAGKFDAVSGLYFTKGDYNMPMAYGDPDEYRSTGVLDFRPRDVREILRRGQVMEVNGIAMGCALWRMDLFREFPRPWFVTVSDVIPERGAVSMTQDLAFCERMKRAGKRLAVDARVHVGHLDVRTGIVY